jgi:predicted AAA+ superfamily ATPase
LKKLTETITFYNMYLHRHIEPILQEAVTQFPVVALLGPRQVGKSTLLQTLFKDTHRYLSFDDLALRTEAKSDPVLFLKNFPGPLILDEIQYVPELLSEIKVQVDQDRYAGRFLLTGSQQFHLMKGFQETLPGRILLLHLHPMTVLEKLGMGTLQPWINILLEVKESRIDRLCTAPSLDRKIFQAVSPIQEIHKGGLPPILSMRTFFHSAFFDSYIQTYLLRDLVTFLPDTDPTQVVRFLRLLAALSGQEINKNQLGRELFISPPTANRWMERLKISLLWEETAPYFSSMIKRIAKHPKGTLFDTGLICHLQGIPDAEALAVHPSIGSVFETAMRLEIRAYLQTYLMPAQLYHWRIYEGKEVDIVLEYKNRLYAFECKWSSEVSEKDLAGLRAFKDRFKEQVAFLGVITPTGHLWEIKEGIYQIPWIPH